jgi:hypothetical protein
MTDEQKRQSPRKTRRAGRPPTGVIQPAREDPSPGQDGVKAPLPAAENPFPLPMKQESPLLRGGSPEDVNQKVPPPLTVSSRTASLLVLLLAILWWYRLSRRYRLRVWRLSVPL